MCPPYAVVLGSDLRSDEVVASDLAVNYTAEWTEECLVSNKAPYMIGRRFQDAASGRTYPDDFVASGKDENVIRMERADSMAWRRFVLSWGPLSDAIVLDHKRRVSGYFIYKKWRKRWIRMWRMVGEQFASDSDRFVNPGYRSLSDPTELRFAQLEIS